MQRTWDEGAQLIAQLNRLRQLTEELSGAQDDSVLRRDVLEQIGRELDAARKALRPHLQK